MIRHRTRRSARAALDRQPVNGFAVEVGAENYTAALGRYFVTHPTPRMWVLNDRERGLNDPAHYGTIDSVLAVVFGTEVR